MSWRRRKPDHGNRPELGSAYADGGHADGGRGDGGRGDGVDNRLVGKLGRITVPVRPGKLGEVLVEIRGGSEAFAAISDEPLAKGSQVVVVEVTGGRSVFVTPFAYGPI